MNRERRKVIGNIFADAAKYALTAGVIGSFLSGKYSLLKHCDRVIFCSICFVSLFCDTERRKGELKMEIYLLVMLGIPAIAGIVFLISFKIQDKRKHSH